MAAPGQPSPTGWQTNLSFSRVEYVRLIEQALRKLGHPSLAQALEQESGVLMLSPAAERLQQHVLAGEWAKAQELLPQLALPDDILRDASFLIYEQQFLEALEGADYEAALGCLRNHMAPLNAHEQQLHQLAGLLLVPPDADLATRRAWLGGGTAQRPHLLAQLQAKLPPALMIPEGRLECLIQQALVSQVSRSQYHNSRDAQLSLFSDYQAGVECLPTKMVQVLEQHTDEVWHVAFSHDGTMLASASKDKSAIIWSVSSASAASPVSPKHLLSAHSAAVALLSWSPDDRLLLTCSEETIRLWDVATGQLLHTFGEHHRESVTACAWMPDSRRFISGSVDKSIYMFDTSGQQLQRWKRPYRVQDLAVTHNGTCIIMASNEQRIHILRLSDLKEVSITECAPITSICLSADSAFLLANLQSHTVHLWSLGHLAAPFPQPLDVGPDPMEQALSPEFQAEYQANDGQQGRWVLRSGFGGSQGTFVVHGSEDGQVYIWHRDSGDLLYALEGHAATVNSVSWNPSNPYMLVSASDDRTIRVWLAESAQPPQQQQQQQQRANGAH